MKKIILFLLLLITLSSFTYADKIINPSQSFTGTEGLQIKYPSVSYGKVNQNYTSYFHIFNLSNGYNYRLGDDINCTLYIYNPLWKPVYAGWSNTFENTFEVEFKLNSTVFNTTGVYSYLIQCENSMGMGGFSGETIIITKNGYDDDKSIFLTLIFAVLGFCFLLLYISFNLEQVHIFLKLLIIFTVIFIQIYLGSVVINLVSETIYESVGFIFYNAILWFIRLFVVYIFIYLIYSIFDYFGKIPKIKGWKKGK